MKRYKFTNGQAIAFDIEPENEVSLEAWRENRFAHADATTLVIPNDVAVESLEGDISSFATIVLNFPTFKDGRAYSQARILRERLNFSGDIAARGEVRRDQALFMQRCGIDSFEIDEARLDGVVEAFSEFSVAYQHAADNTQAIWRQRTERAAVVAA